MKYSIITPVVFDKESEENVRQPRYELFFRCANSVFAQTCTDFEWVIADDMCKPPVEEILEKHDSWNQPKGLQVKVIRMREKSGRIQAQNAAMKAATGEWICCLDADDEYASIYLEAIDQAIKLYPTYDMFNMNHLVFHYDFKTEVRKFLDMEKIGDRPFGSGTIGQGAYVFKRSLLEKTGYIPEMGLWQLRDWAFEKYPEVKEFFWNEQQQGYNSLGNPWGNDWLLFYMLTRITKCKYLDTALYFVHSHFGHRFREDPNFSIGTPADKEFSPLIQ